MDIFAFLILLWFLLPIPFLVLWLLNRDARKKSDAEASSLKERFAPITSLEDERSRLAEEIKETKAKTEAVRAAYAEKRKLLETLQTQVAVYDERLSFAELGVYEPHFDFGDSEAFKEKIKEVRERQKAMVSSKEATLCPTQWTVEGSRSKGKTMINRQTRLTMRAFNNECEAAIANIRWNNAAAMEKRILNAAKQIDSANSSMNLRINDEYVALKLEELFLTHEYREQLKIEKEERAELARAEREEKKLLADAEAADRKEREYQKLLDKARSEVGADQGRIAELEAQLAEAHAMGERARAMAEMTRSGYVYVISNIGSFGEDVVKIGLTRRLEPDDRVKELGDASVPFGFDTHAMIYSDEAPALENALHKEFADRRINMSNMRKEFFRVELAEVEDAVRKLAPDANFFTDREAQEWHETLARRRQTLEQLQTQGENALPAEI
ncbi:protein of unknown function [Thalassococcus halodurans]|uniref:Bacteriophage T5 Orf172 DNA-binding domain-containing protein n=1 Tax=Thalassococcus halodurans TaxID=373675 RepID=A0A1H6AIB8_9RHOB|nr:DUF4041 domain-containing protein [Thalassococcus halodurans]SEG47765.1 protein of unknown function [Thalassococcus halodurans]